MRLLAQIGIVFVVLYCVGAITVWAGVTFIEPLADWITRRFPL
jgi:hypothetical protein